MPHGTTTYMHYLAFKNIQPTQHSSTARLLASWRGYQIITTYSNLFSFQDAACYSKHEPLEA